MIGAISDDFTGATDVALAFRARGLRTRLYLVRRPTPPLYTRWTRPTLSLWP